MPAIRQVFIACSTDVKGVEAIERKLYVIRKRATTEAENLGLFDPELFYFCSLSALTVVYKGQLISTQIPQFFPDLLNKAVKTALAMVHQRFSTNTFPSWERAHPYRFMSHNGEINTLRGHINWLVVMASETGVLDIAPENVAHKGRLQPGRMFLIDTSLGRIVQDEEIKESMAAQKPYRNWLDSSLVTLESLPEATGAPAVDSFEDGELLKQQ